MKKIVSLLLSLVMVMAMVACGDSDVPTNEAESTSPVTEEVTEPAEALKAGLICLHNEQSTYDLNFITAFKAACDEMGVEAVIKTGVGESEECLQAAEDLADSGCFIIFADSFGHEPYMLQAAQEFPEIEFCHATGTNAHTAGVANFHNAFAAIYEGRYLAGIAAGAKLNAMIEAGQITAEQAKMGYVGAFAYAEVISGYTSFYLGAKSVCPSVTMDVTFTGSWYDESMEKEAALLLIRNGCVLISQHADSMGAPTACENNGIPNVSYNGSTVEACPNTYIISSRINWQPYFMYAMDCAQNGKQIEADWIGTIATGSVELTDLNESVAAAGTADLIAAATEKLNNGVLHVFDTSTFTVDGAALTNYLADVDSDDAFTPDTDVIINDYFDESAFRSAPYFDLTIDGITLLDSTN